MEGVQHLMASLLYGTGMRLMECVRLRVQDVDFNYHQLVVRDGKGQKDRVVPLPLRLKLPLREQLEQTRAQHQEDLDLGFGEVFLPDALARKWTNAAREWIWQYAFPSGQLSVDPRSGKTRRHHIHENGPQKAVKVAAQKAGITKKVNCHSLRDNRGQTAFFRARRATTTRRTHTTRMLCAPYCLSRMSLAATRKSTGSSESL